MQDTPDQVGSGKVTIKYRDPRFAELDARIKAEKPTRKERLSGKQPKRYRTGHRLQAAAAGHLRRLGAAGCSIGNGRSSSACQKLSRRVVSQTASASVCYGETDAREPAGATELGPDSVVTGDFNRDGKLDLAVRNQSSVTVSVLQTDRLSLLPILSSVQVQSG